MTDPVGATAAEASIDTAAEGDIERAAEGDIDPAADEDASGDTWLEDSLGGTAAESTAELAFGATAPDDGAPPSSSKDLPEP